jgi:hypothetical protein
MTDVLDKTTIRGLVREVISEIVTDRVKGHKGETGDSGKATSQAKAVVEEISIASDADLAVFVKHLLSLSKNTEAWLAIEEGDLTFQLKGEVPGGSGPHAARGASKEKLETIECGPVSEARMVALGRAGVTRLVLGRTAVLTPLARDRARELNIYVQKETR